MKLSTSGVASAATRESLSERFGHETTTMFTSMSESQPHVNDIKNIHHKHYKCAIVVPPHSLGSPSMYKPEEGSTNYEEVKHGHGYFPKLTKCE